MRPPIALSRAPSGRYVAALMKNMAAPVRLRWFSEATDAGGTRAAGRAPIEKLRSRSGKADRPRVGRLDLPSSAAQIYGGETAAGSSGRSDGVRCSGTSIPFSSSSIVTTPDALTFLTKTTRRGERAIGAGVPGTRVGRRDRSAQITIAAATISAATAFAHSTFVIPWLTISVVCRARGRSGCRGRSLRCKKCHVRDHAVAAICRRFH